MEFVKGNNKSLKLHQKIKICHITSSFYLYSKEALRKLHIQGKFPSCLGYGQIRF